MFSLLRLTLPDVLKTVSPLVAVVIVLQVVLVHAPAPVFLRFLAGAALAALGMLLLFAGIDLGILPMGRFIHPRVEPEIAFLLKRPLAGQVSAAEALACVEAVAPALEIIDSRYHDFKFSLPEVVADNASSSGFVVGRWCDPREGFGNLGLTLCIDGRAVQLGSTAAILGHPLRLASRPGRGTVFRVLLTPTDPQAAAERAVASVAQLLPAKERTI